MKQIISNYSFNAVAKTVTFTDFGTIDLNRVLLIVNVTDNVIIYQFNDPAKGGSVATNVLTLDYDTSGMDNADNLQIFYDADNGDPTYSAVTPVQQGDLSDDIDSVAQRGLFTTGSYSATAIGVLVPSTNVRKYKKVIVRLSGTWSGYVNFFFGANGTDFSIYRGTGTGGTYIMARIDGYFKAEVASYTSGTIQADVLFTNDDVEPSIGNANATVPTHLTYMGIRGTNDGLVGLNTATVLGDGADGNRILGVGQFGYNGATYDRRRAANVYKTVATSTSGNTAVWTPASGKRFRLMGYSIEVTADAAQSSGGVVTVKFQDSTTDLGIAHSVFIPGTAGSSFASNWQTGMMPLDNGRLSAAANNVLNINLSSALTSGAVRVNVHGTEE